jgi:hypothetical protein
MAVEGITLQITRLGLDGEALDQARLNSMIRVLPPSRSTILATTFQSITDAVVTYQLNLLSAVQVSNPEGRTIPVEATIVEIEKLQNDRLFRLSVEVDVLTETVEPGYVIILQVNGFGSTGTPLGTNSVQWNVLPEELPLSIDLDLFSLNGPLQDFELLAEALPLSQVP